MLNLFLIWHLHFYFGSLQNSLEHFIPVQPPKPEKTKSYPQIKCNGHMVLPMRRSFSFTLFLWWRLLGFVVSSTSLNPWVVVVVAVVVVGADVVVVEPEPLPWMTFWFRGQQILGMLFVKPQENFERNFSFSFVIWFSRIFSAIKIKT